MQHFKVYISLRISSFSCFWVCFLFSEFFPLDAFFYFPIFLCLISFDWLLDIHHAVVWILLVSSQQILICFGGIFNFLWKSRLALLLRSFCFGFHWWHQVSVRSSPFYSLKLVYFKSYITSGSFFKLNVFKKFLSPANKHLVACVYRQLLYVLGFLVCFYFVFNLDWLFKLFLHRQLFSLTVCVLKFYARNMQKLSIYKHKDSNFLHNFSQ